MTWAFSNRESHYLYGWEASQGGHPLGIPRKEGFHPSLTPQNWGYAEMYFREVLKRGAAPLFYYSPFPLGKGVRGMGPSPPDR